MRDDVESGFLSHYLEQHIIDRLPLETTDQKGVGWPVRQGEWVGRETRPTSSSASAASKGGR